MRKEKLLKEGIVREKKQAEYKDLGKFQPIHIAKTENMKGVAS